MIEKIDINKIRGRYNENSGDISISDGDDTTESLKLLASKINEIVEVANNRQYWNMPNTDCGPYYHGVAMVDTPYVEITPKAIIDQKNSTNKPNN